MINYYDQIKEKLIDNEIYEKVKDYSKERHKVITYFEIGKLLNEAGKHYGEGIIKEYSMKLSIDVGKGYNVSNLKRMRKIYNIVLKGATLSHHLTWSHYTELFPLSSIYINTY